MEDESPVMTHPSQVHLLFCLPAQREALSGKRCNRRNPGWEAPFTDICGKRSDGLSRKVTYTVLGGSRPFGCDFGYHTAVES